MFLDITGLEHLFGSETALARKIVRDFADCGLAVRIAIADTLGAAWAVVHFGNCKLQISNCKYQIEARGNEKIFHFSFCNVHSTFCILPSGQTAAALAPLPIEALRLPEETVELLHSLGIERIEQLELLPREDLECRFGARLIERWDQALGRLAEPIPVQPFPPRFEARLALEYPTASRQTVSLVLERLVARVAQMLARGGRGAVRLECRLDCQSGGPVEFAVGLFQPSASPRHLGQLLSMRLERLSIPSPVTAIALEAALTDWLEHRQEELFADGPARHHPWLLAALVDRLTSRLGRQPVLRARLVPEAQPELAYEYDPLVWTIHSNKRGSSKRSLARPLSHQSTGASSLSRPFHTLVDIPLPRIATMRRTREEAPVLPPHPGATPGLSSSGDLGKVARPEKRRAWPGSRAARHAHRSALGMPHDAAERRTRGEAPVLLPRPLRLLRQPVAVVAISVIPDGPPFSFHFRGQEYRIARSWGPERIETGWWRGRPIARDYYRVETTTGQRFWLFRSLDEGRWFLHGDFE